MAWAIDSGANPPGNNQPGAIITPPGAILGLARMMPPFDRQAEGLTWISPQSLIRLRHDAESISLHKGRIRAKQGGAYLSSFKGRGMEFNESRLYQPGDDIRNMDWRVTARTGKPHTKVFQEERERPVLLCVDLGPSMHFATRGCFKSVLACKLAGLVGWSATANGDRLGGLVFSADAHVEIRPRRGKAATLDFIGRCCRHPSWQERNTSAGATRSMLETGLGRLYQVSHPGSLVFIISDFRDMNPAAFSRLAGIARHNEVVLLHVYDPFEARLPATGDYLLSDGRHTRLLHCHHHPTRRQHARRFAQRRHELQKFCRQHRIHLCPARTDGDALRQLQQGLGVNVHGRSKTGKRSA